MTMYDDEINTVTIDQLKLISDLAEAQLALEALIAEGESAVKVLQNKLRKIAEIDLPDAMAAAGCKAYTLTSGQSITIKEGLTASVPAARKGEVCEWLRANGYGDLVSEQVSVDFGRGEEERIRDVLRLLDAEGFDPACKTDVNTARLKALISEQLEKGVDMPLELLGAYQWKKAVVK